MKRLCSICVRGGSKGVPGKNTRILKGKPLFVHSLKQARQSKIFDFTAVSSDSSEILDLAKRNGADIIVNRPSELASDEAAKLPTIKHCLRQVELSLNTKMDIIIDLDATSPLRNKKDIQGVLRMLEKNDKQTNIITGSKSRRSPYFNLVEVDQHGMVYLSGVNKLWRKMVISPQNDIEHAVNKINNLGQILFVTDERNILIGTITDSDIRKGIILGLSLKENVNKIMNQNPTVINKGMDEEEIFNKFTETNLLHLPVINSQKELVNVRSMDTISRRQDSPECFDLNASIYGWWRDGLINSNNIITEKTKLFLMPEERSVDIDTELDFKWVNFLMKDCN